MRPSITLATAALLCASPLPTSLAGSVDARALEVSRGDAELELRVHDPRGRDYDATFESVIELRRAGRRVHRNRYAFGVRHAALHGDGRVVLAGEALDEVHGLRADVSVLCFLDADGNTTAVHEVSTPRRPRRRVAHGPTMCGLLTPPPPANRPWRFDALLPMESGWTLAVESRRVASEREARWRVFDAAGSLLGALDEHELSATPGPDLFLTSACVLPRTQVVVATWMMSGEAGIARRMTVHDLAARFAGGAEQRAGGPLYSIALPGELDSARAIAMGGEHPRVVVRDEAQNAPPGGYIVRRAPDGTIRVQRSGDGQPPPSDRPRCVPPASQAARPANRTRPHMNRSRQVRGVWSLRRLVPLHMEGRGLTCSRNGDRRSVLKENTGSWPKGGGILRRVDSSEWTQFLTTEEDER